MEVCSLELQVKPGMAGDFDLESLHFGLLIHLRLPSPKRAATLEKIDFWPFRLANGDPNVMPGVQVNRTRLELERGHETELDHRLVRTSTFTLQFDNTSPLGKPNLQEVFLLVKTRDKEGISPTLGLTVHILEPNPRTIPCREGGPPPELLWCCDEWRNNDPTLGVPYSGDLSEYLQELEERVSSAGRKRESPHWHSGIRRLTRSRDLPPCSKTDDAPPFLRNLSSRV